MKLKANCGWEKFRGPALKSLRSVKKRIKKKFNWDLLKWIANFISLFHVIARIVTAILSWVHSLGLEHSFVNSSSNFILYLPYFIFVILLFFPAKSKSKNKRNKLQAPPSNLYASNLIISSHSSCKIHLMDLYLLISNLTKKIKNKTFFFCNRNCSRKFFIWYLQITYQVFILQFKIYCRFPVIMASVQIVTNPISKHQIFETPNKLSFKKKYIFFPKSFFFK